MRYGICPLSLVPVYESPDAGSRLATQLLYGECFKVLESRKAWHRIRVHFDASEGWVRDGQFTELDENTYQQVALKEPSGCAADLIGHLCTPDDLLIPVLLGSDAGNAGILKHQYEGAVFPEGPQKDQLATTALLYLHSPEMEGGRSPFGIDAAGLAQMVYKCCGYPLKRTPAAQATQGTALSFIEESAPGDLAFFDGPDGAINHVGIIMQDNYIIHAFGQVRIDRLDHTGIFNTERRRYTHSLRVIKQIL